MLPERTVEVVLRATVHLADADLYEEGMSLLECAQFDFEVDPAGFLMDQIEVHGIEVAP
jgi:hypothetical protein